MEGVFLIMLPLVALTMLLLVTHYLFFALEWAVMRVREVLSDVE